MLARSGDVVLLGNDVQTGKDGLVQAPAGAVVLAAGQRIEITGRGLEGIHMELVAREDRWCISAGWKATPWASSRGFSGTAARSGHAGHAHRGQALPAVGGTAERRRQPGQ
ncbi:hypothetical protein HK414_18345 [Ramlibacter terrae]|uniref:Uncharacterized protein n=1 Tax=Ramlibacter terrae TaxID=2732511 RepID=A0ABX6P492_9BURK|nr:hypothetical protein HK414_18345 [Ramlibacter terrae]